MNAKAARLLAAFDGLEPGATVVEIGCARFPAEIASDGWSTVHLAHAGRGWVLHSVDRDPAAVSIARELTAGSDASVHLADGRDWLQAFGGTISGLYLDGSADPDDALAQYQAATLADDAVVVIDDVQPIADHRHGKGDALLDVLAADGFTVDIHETEPGYLMAVARRP